MKRFRCVVAHERNQSNDSPTSTTPRRTLHNTPILQYSNATRKQQSNKIIRYNHHKYYKKCSIIQCHTIPPDASGQDRVPANEEDGSIQSNRHPRRTRSTRTFQCGNAAVAARSKQQYCRIGHRLQVQYTSYIPIVDTYLLTYNYYTFLRIILRAKNRIRILPGAETIRDWDSL